MQVFTVFIIAKKQVARINRVNMENVLSHATFKVFNQNFKTDIANSA